MAANAAAALAACLAASLAAPAGAAPKAAARPTAEQRAEATLRRMSAEEKLSLLRGHFPLMQKPLPPGVVLSAGYIPGVPRLGIPDLRESDASLGVANAGRADDDATALPSSMALAATWNPKLAFAGGAMIGKQTRQKGFNILLAGGVNLTRDPFNGRNFEYLGEDPLLAGTMDAELIRGIQSQHIASTAKHFVLNAQESGRHFADARISEAALRESDLLAFEIAIKRGRPASVMCSYNRINGPYACENRHLLTDVLKTDWAFKGWTMSDWGAVHSTAAAQAGLDQQSGAEIDPEPYFGAPLAAAAARGAIPQARVDDMVRRILYGVYADGLADPQPPAGALDTAADNAVAQAEAEAGIVLLKNDGGILPLAAGARRIAVIGGHADRGVLSGGGSSQVVPLGSLREPAPKGAPFWLAGKFYHPSAPLQAIRARAGGGEVGFASGEDLAAAVALARSAEVAVVFAEQWTTEGMDAEIRLSAPQEALIQAVAAANPNTVVVLENGGPLLMPWLGAAKAVVEAWYPGGKGGEAIARILFGEVDPSGRLPATFAAGPEQLARPTPPGADLAPGDASAPPAGKALAIDYVEGSSVGYRWFAEKQHKPLFPFGYGLSYTQFRYGRATVTGGKALTVEVTVANTGARAGVETVQLYLRKGPSRAQQRLLGWTQVSLAPGESRRVRVAADPQLLANWDEASHGWRIDAGRYEVFAGPNAAEPAAEGTATLRAAWLKP